MEHSGQKIEFDRRLWRRFWNIARLYWVGDQRWQAHGLLLLLIVLLLGRTELTVLFNQQSGELTSALAAHDGPRFWHSMRVFGVALALGVPVYAVYYFVRDTLGITWRRWLTGDYLRRYFERHAVYRVAFDRHIDNPDQRIAEDVGAFSQKSLKVLVEIVGAVLQLLVFSGILWAISRPLVWLLLAYALAGTVLSVAVFGKPLIGLNFQQLRREADFRFGLIRARENAEAIAFYAGERPEELHLLQRFAALFTNFKALLRTTLRLNVFQYAFTFATYLLPGLIMAPRILSGELEVGRLVQASGAFAAMLEALSIFVDNFEMLAGFAAGVERLHAFGQALDRAQLHIPSNASTIATIPAPKLELSHLTIVTPDGTHTLVRDLSLSVIAARGLLVTGPSGCGKSSLLRAIAGLWQRGSGRILRPSLAEILFLPQHPYLVLGTLRDQLLYPTPAREASDAELREVLASVNLQHLPERYGGLDAKRDFAKLLSVGEQQRLSIARVLLHRPRYVMLDEATSALDEANERALYELLLASGMTLISVAHRSELARYHSQILHLTGDGGWHLAESPRAAASAQQPSTPLSA